MSPDHQPVEKGHPMNDPSVRKMKRADELVVGDWLAQDESGHEVPSEVLAVFQYPTAAGDRVHLTTRVPGKPPYSSAMPPEVEQELASEAELAAANASAERAQKIAEIRQLADFLEANPWLPVPYRTHSYEHLSAPEDVPSEAAGVAKVREVAERLGLKADEHLDDRTEVTIEFGKSDFQLVAWHKDGRPAEPAPDFVDGPCLDQDCPNASWPHLASSDLAELAPEPGGHAYRGDGVSGCDALLAGKIRCGAGRSLHPEPHPSWPAESELKPWESLAPQAERIAESMKPIDPDSSMEAHYDAEADALGLAYSRADDEPDDPTPVSPARVPLHTGAVTDGGLVDDEAECPSSWHANQGDKRSRCPICNEAD
jgi:hypothetical protein